MNKKLGIIKKIDNLGRIVIPKDIRNRLLLEKEVEIVLTNEGILLRKPDSSLEFSKIDKKIGIE